DLQDRIDTARAEEGGSVGTTKDMLDDLQHRVDEREGGAVLSGAGEGVAARSKAELFGYLLGLEIGRTFGEEEVDEGTALRVSEDVLREIQDGTSHSTSRDELDKLNGRVVRRGGQPGEANF
ncbi:MAG: hypothetical protein D8G53_10960, partial [Candidatus Saccharimonas sp.]